MFRFFSSIFLSIKREHAQNSAFFLPRLLSLSLSPSLTHHSSQKVYAKSDCASPYHFQVYIFRIYFMRKRDGTKANEAALEKHFENLSRDSGTVNK